MSGGDLNDFSMLGLFRVESETQAQALSDGLVKLEENLSDLSLIEPLMRAAHSLKGAARIVQLDAVVTLAHAMEDCFVAAQEGKVSLNSEHIDAFLKSVDLISEIASIDEKEIPQWLESKSVEIDKSADMYSKICKGEIPGGETKVAEEKKSEPLEHKDLSDFSMLGLFRVEAETNAQTLNNGLMKLEENPSDVSLVEPLMRAAHSLKGAARIVQLDAVVTLAHAMEDCFVATQEGKVSLNSSHIDKLLAGVDLFAQISLQEENGINDFMSANIEKISTLSGIYEDMKTGKFIEEDSVEDNSKNEKAELPQEKEKPENEKKTSFSKDSFVRVSSDKLNRLLGLAGESLVDVKQIDFFEKNIAGLKKDFMDISESIANLYENSMDEELSEKTRNMMFALREKSNNFYNSISENLTEVSDFSLRYDNFSGKLYDEVVSCRMRPFEDGAQGFPRMVRDVSKKLGKKVKFEIIGRKTDVDRDILEKLEAPLNHLIRNAIDHGLESFEDRKKAGKSETGSVRLLASHWAGMLNITVEDDGKGIDIEKLREKVVAKGHATEEMAENMSDSELLDFLFLPGFSTASSVTEISGRGVGLDVVQNMAQEVRGVLSVETELGKGTKFHLQLPITLSVVSTLLVEIGNEPYAFPLMKIDRLLTVSRNDIKNLENHQFLNYENTNMGLVSATEALGFEAESLGKEDVCVVVISDRLNQYAVVVDKFVEERELVVRPLDERLGKVANISAASVMEDGSPVLIIDVDDMVRSIDNLLKGGRLHKLKDSKADGSGKKKRILVVDDSITVREVERNLLANKGYDVETAVDGADGWNALRTGSYDLVVTDVDMPRMNGFELVERIKKHEKLKDIPVMIVSYKDREEDKLRGIDAGANYYLTKSSFHDNTLIDAVYNLIGEAGQ